MSALDKALTKSKKFNFDEFEIISIKKKITTIRITDSIPAEIKENFNENYGIRAIQDKKIMAIQTANPNEIEKKIEYGLKSISNISSKNFWKGLPYDTNPNQIEGTFDKKLENITLVEAEDIVQKIINLVENSKINTITGSLNIVSEEFKIANSNGLDLDDKATYISAIINAESEQSTIPVSGIGHSCGRTLKNFSVEQISNDAKTMCLESINPQKIESKKYSIIFEPYSVGEILSFVVASNLNLRTVSEQKSCFSDKLQKEIGISQLNLEDDPHLPEGIGTKTFDDEGMQTNKIKLIEDGIFKNTYSNLFDSYKENKKSSGNGIRMGSPLGRSSEPIPIAAPHNLKIQSGSISQEDMIKDTEDGLLVGRLWYTYAVNPIKGDFSCTARSGIRVIKNGEIVSPGKSVRIIHNIQKLFKNISEIGNKQKNVIQWTSLPSYVPSIKVKEISVSSI